MNQIGTFVWAMTVTACLTTADRLLIGSDEPEARPLARSLGTATISGCRVAGRIESRPQGVFAVFDVDNDAGAPTPLAFHYLASRTPPTSPFSRMEPRPETVKAGFFEAEAGSGRTTGEVLLRETPAATPAPTGAPATNGVRRLERAAGPEVWTLVVSLEPIKGVHGWGAAAPAASGAAIPLDKGEAVLAVTVPDKPAQP